MSYMIRPMPIVGISKLVLLTHRLGRFYSLKRNKNVFDTYKKKMVQIIHRVVCSYIGCYVPFSAKVCRGLVLPHGFYGIFLSRQCKINFGVTLLHQVTLGSNPLSSNSFAPTIGSYSFIGAGAKIIGNVKLESNSVVSVNDVITVSVQRERLE